MPVAMPMAATTQMVAALVRPETEPRMCRMVPAPMKPTPVMTLAAMRSGLAWPPMSSERCVNRAAPTQIRMLVRSPAGLPFISRSMPMAPPSTAASASCSSSSRRSERASSGRVPFTLGRLRRAGA